MAGSSWVINFVLVPIGKERAMFMDSFRALPRWKKVLTALSLLFIWPWVLFVGGIFVLACLPFALFGRWEGDLGKRPMINAAKSFVRHRADATKHYYATT